MRLVLPGVANCFRYKDYKSLCVCTPRTKEIGLSNLPLIPRGLSVLNAMIQWASGWNLLNLDPLNDICSFDRCFLEVLIKMLGHCSVFLHSCIIGVFLESCRDASFRFPNIVEFTLLTSDEIYKTGAFTISLLYFIRVTVDLKCELILINFQFLQFTQSQRTAKKARGLGSFIEYAVVWYHSLARKRK